MELEHDHGVYEHHASDAECLTVVIMEMRNYYKLNCRLNLPAESIMNARRDRIHDLTECIYMFYKNIYIL